MPRRPFILLALLLIPFSLHAELSAERQRELIHLLKHDCGSCHGMTLQGGLGSALTPEALASRPAELMVSTILDGRPGTPMPPWRSMLTREEVEWLVDKLYEGDTNVP
ncbi:MAG: cytochrome c [Gammaproteobacteria bacterium]|nr:cytochrome c [Gammaproteobacteria bacterium]NIR98591.1 cytochrome c [Gammaproteobacteria bacterium]NIT64314.1 cytochrome c [Gammaproteobacteria bacterium]NIV21238.1 cytochrome c [Gammaproteobacteria bacterium]NIX10942.1 cytochrome c [Gammaproteobacteria bacterium]